MGVEIERKYRVTRIGEEVVLPPGERFVQGYLASGAFTVRVRLRPGGAVLTIKFDRGEMAAGDPIVSREFEYAIPVEDAEVLLAATPHKIEKTRHFFPNGVELDIFHGAHEGLVLAEYEHPEGAAAPPVEGLQWVEVTEDRRYSNSWMSRNGVPDAPGG